MMHPRTCMFSILKIPGWRLHERLATGEEAFISRRTALGKLHNMLVPAALLKVVVNGNGASLPPPQALRNQAYSLDRPLTPEAVASRYNNFREFSDQKEAVWMIAERFPTTPWTVKVGGLVRKPQTF